MKAQQMQHESYGGGVGLLGVITGWIITNVTMNEVIGLVTAVGGTFYALNQVFIFLKSIKRNRLK